MSEQFKWEGNVLRGPVALLVGQQIQLPRGPPEAAPFNTGKWSLRLSSTSEGWQLHKFWTSSTTRAADLSVTWSVTNPANPTSPPPFTKSDKIGAILRRPQSSGSYGSEPVELSCDEHVGTGSQFALEVICPSLHDWFGKPSVPATASFVFGEYDMLLVRP